MLQVTQQHHSLVPAGPANRGLGPEPAAYSWSSGIIKDHAPVVTRKMDTGYSCWLATRHSGYGRGDGGSNTTGPAFFTTFHLYECSSHELQRLQYQLISVVCEDRSRVSSSLISPCVVSPSHRFHKTVFRRADSYRDPHPRKHSVRAWERSCW